jgi:hypothetical protein
LNRYPWGRDLILHLLFPRQLRCHWWWILKRPPPGTTMCRARCGSISTTARGPRPSVNRVLSAGSRKTPTERAFSCRRVIQVFSS